MMEWKLAFASLLLATVLGCATQVQRADTEDSGTKQQQKSTAPPTITHGPGAGVSIEGE